MNAVEIEEAVSELDRMMKDSTKRKFDVVLVSVGGAWRDGCGGGAEQMKGNDDRR